MGKYQEVGSEEVDLLDPHGVDFVFEILEAFVADWLVDEAEELKLVADLSPAGE